MITHLWECPECKHQSEGPQIPGENVFCSECWDKKIGQNLMKIVRGIMRCDGPGCTSTDTTWELWSRGTGDKLWYEVTFTQALGHIGNFPTPEKNNLYFCAIDCRNAWFSRQLSEEGNYLAMMRAPAQESHE